MMKQYALIKLLCVFVFIASTTYAADDPSEAPSRKRERSVEVIETRVEPPQKRLKGDEVGSEEALSSLMAHHLPSDEPLSPRETVELQNKLKALPEHGVMMPEAIRLAFDRLRYSKWNPREIREYKIDVVDREENLVMLACERSEGREEGREEGEKLGLEKGEKIGLEKGREEERKGTAYRLHQKGMSAQDISEITGLPIETVQSLCT